MLIVICSNITFLFIAHNFYNEGCCIDRILIIFNPVDGDSTMVCRIQSFSLHDVQNVAELRQFRQLTELSQAKHWFEETYVAEGQAERQAPLDKSKGEIHERQLLGETVQELQGDLQF